MDMMEMMDDQDGRDLSCSFSPSASLFLCWIPLSLCLSVCLSLWHHPESDSSAV